MRLEDLFDLSGRTALVTGGSRGLGLAMATALGEMGAKLAITARKPEELADAQKSLAAAGFEVFARTCDLSRPETIDPMVDAAVAALGPIDILVNNAGTTWGAPAEDYPLDGWRKVTDVNLTGTWLVTQKVARDSMIPRTFGRIINIASVAGLKGTVGRGFQAIAYNTSKGGLISFSRALAAEWGRYNITVNAICPGFIPSKMSRVVLDRIGEEVAAATPLGRLGTDDDMKGLVVLLASEAGRHITGQAIAVDGGMTAV
jgi:NAD(P)-dependent dehydrogenase (short-subunit alcohol dehydrogenase family)